MYTKLVVLFFAAFSLSLSALDIRSTERPTQFAVLSELGDQGQTLPSDYQYELTVNIREGVSKHYTSFEFCAKPKSETGERERATCELFWVVVPKESLRCTGERFMSLAGSDTGETDPGTPSWLELVVLSQPNANCGSETTPTEPAPAKAWWRVRLHQEGSEDRFFEGAPRRVLLFQQ